MLRSNQGEEDFVRSLGLTGLHYSSIINGIFLSPSNPINEHPRHASANAICGYTDPSHTY